MDASFHVYASEIIDYIQIYASRREDTGDDNNLIVKIFYYFIENLTYFIVYFTNLYRNVVILQVVEVNASLQSA